VRKGNRRRGWVIRQWDDSEGGQRFTYWDEGDIDEEEREERI